jgi:hypothetical protein
MGEGLDKNVVVAEAGFVRVAAPIVARGGKGGTD